MTNLSTWQNSNYTVYAMTVFFFLLSLWGISNHELWLDEAHHYLLARDSSSVQDLINNTRYEGHPIVWNLLLYWITRLTTDPIWMQILHISIMTISVGVFLKKAPFSWLFKLLFIFGYFMFYEYNILSRNYSIGILFIFLGCSFYDKRTVKFVLISVLLGLASNSHAIFVILASTIMAMLTLERLKTERLQISKSTWIGVGIFGVLTLVSVLQIIPPTDTSFFDRGESISFFDKIAKSMTPFFKSMFVLPDVTINSFWNSHILVNYSKPIAAIVAMISLSIPYLLFYKNRNLLMYVYFGIFATAGFFFITMMNAARYYGILYLFLITALWFEKSATSTGSAYHFAKAKKTFLLSENLLKNIRPVLIYSILGLHFISGIYAFTMDVSRPFTTAQQTAQYLKENNLIEKTIATKACNGTALSAYIGKAVYFTRTNSFESYCTFNRPSIQQEHGTIEVITSIQKLLKANKESVIFITYEPFFDTSQKKEWRLYNEAIKIEFLTQFEGSILNKGNHYIYEISKY
ncbi:hypothetical protein [Dokdonia sp.]|uniref:hypothetical protein n=1 Tax=Dokdonia sp. TaxID=2024995 RepID=UPI0032667E0F